MIKTIRESKIFSKYPTARQFIKFCLVGATNFVIDFSVYLVLTRYFKVFYILATTASFFLAVSWSFYLNRRWTFRHNGLDLRRQYVKFFIANGLALVGNLSIFSFMIEVLRIHDLVAKVLVTIVMAFFNFSLNKFWTFKKNG